MTENQKRQRRARRALAAAYPVETTRGEEPTADLAGDLLADVLHLVVAQADGDEAERLEVAEEVAARAWRNLIAELWQASRDGASSAGASLTGAAGLTTYTGLRDFLDGYANERGEIGGDPATIAGEAAAAGLVATDEAHDAQIGGAS